MPDFSIELGSFNEKFGIVFCCRDGRANSDASLIGMNEPAIAMRLKFIQCFSKPRMI